MDDFIAISSPTAGILLCASSGVEHLVAYQNSLRDKGCSNSHVTIVMARLEKMIAGCGIATLADANAAIVESWLAKRQREEKLTHITMLARAGVGSVTA